MFTRGRALVFNSLVHVPDLKRPGLANSMSNCIWETGNCISREPAPFHSLGRMRVRPRPLLVLVPELPSVRVVTVMLTGVRLTPLWLSFGFFMCLLAVSVSSFGEMLLNSLCTFPSGGVAAESGKYFIRSGHESLTR